MSDISPFNMFPSLTLPNPEPSSALDLAARIASLGVAISGLELLSIRREFETGGLFSSGTTAPFRQLSSRLSANSLLVPLLLTLQVSGALAIFFVGLSSGWSALCLLASSFSLVAARWLRQFGGDGAEQMGVIVLAAAICGVCPWPSESRVRIAVAFVAAQVSLSYVTAGIAKLMSPMWRSGRALPAILMTHDHGVAWASACLHAWPTVALLLGWAVIVFECLFPLLILGPGWLCAATLIGGLIFHVGCALLMGLNSFIWSFIATYPCVLALVGMIKAL
jgi:hypothetical protein